MSPSLFPFFAYLIPSKNACFVTSINLWFSLLVFPTTNVLAASPLYPFFNATVSMLTMSPSFNFLYLDGIPCITSSFIDTHIDAGNLGTPFIPGSYPFSAGSAPNFLIVCSAISSNSNVVTPGFMCFSNSSYTSATTLPASLINSISLFDFIVTNLGRLLFYYILII